MNQLTEPETAWIAGVYEGEGSCAITKGRAVRVEIAMTDEDVVSRIATLTGLGHVVKAPLRGNNKQVYRWGIGSAEAVEFLEAIFPWLGSRRAARASDAITNWKTNKKQSTKNDTECINGHSYDPPNKRLDSGSCRMCANEASQRYRARKRVSA